MEVFKDSDDDKPFDGFTIRDVRYFLPTGSESEVFKAKPVQCLDNHNSESSDIDGELDSDTADTLPSSPVENNCSALPPVGPSSLHISQSEEEEIEGEMAETVFEYQPAMGSSQSEEVISTNESSDYERDFEVEGEMDSDIPQTIDCQSSEDNGDSSSETNKEPELVQIRRPRKRKLI